MTTLDLTDLLPANGVPFRSLRNGTTFRFPEGRADLPMTKTDDRGGYTDASGDRYRTSPATVVIPAAPRTAARTITLTPGQVAALADVFGDAWQYRIGEATGLDDPDLDPEDLDHLNAAEALRAALGVPESH